MGRLLVVLHIFYHDQVDYFIDKLGNISGCEWDLTVTYSEEIARTNAAFRQFRSDVRFVKVENVGYDVWPFIKVLKMIDLSGYAYILKLHTKQKIADERTRLQGIRLNEYRWRDLLVNSILKTPERFIQCIGKMEANPDIGYICSYELYTRLTKTREEDTTLLNGEAERASIPVKHTGFCAGTMFLARADALKFIEDIELTADMFPKKSRSSSAGTLAHVYERLLCIAMTDAGYRPKRMITDPMATAQVFFHRKINPFFKFVFDLDRDKIDRKKYLTLLGHRFLVADAKQ